MTNPFEQLGIIGLGLLGSSLACACRERNLAKTITGLDINPAHAQANLLEKRIDKLVDSYSSFAECDLVVLCADVRSIQADAEKLMSALGPKAIVTDVGSTKMGIVQAFDRAESALPHTQAGTNRFVGSHPIAGSEITGPAGADAQLFVNRVCVVTPSPHTNNDHQQRVQQFWQALGMRTVVCSPEEHDGTLARTSHVCHLVSFALSAIQHTNDAMLAGPGLTGMVRLAKSSSTLWRTIIEDNQPAVLAACRQFSDSFRQLELAIEARDYDRLEKLLDDGNIFAKHLGNQHSQQTGLDLSRTPAHRP